MLYNLEHVMFSCVQLYLRFFYCCFFFSNICKIFFFCRQKLKNKNTGAQNTHAPFCLFQRGMFRILCLSCLLNYIVISYNSINLISFAVLFCDLYFQSKIFQSTNNNRTILSFNYIQIFFN